MLVPLTREDAQKWLSVVHRHLSSPAGDVIRVGVRDETGLRGVACAGRPVARALDDGWTLEITRVGVLPDTPNACSMLYGALRRAGQALGYVRFITYTRADEPGMSLKAAGWRDDGLAGAREGSRTARDHEQTAFSGPKRRWRWP
jgi:hypothetical protein